VGIGREYTGISDTLTHLGNGSQVNVGGSGALLPLGNAVLFDGTDDYITMGNVLNVTIGDFSVAGWFKTTGTGNQVILGKRDGGGLGWQVSVNSSNVALALDDGGSVAVTGSTVVSDNEWHHVVFITDRTTGYIYLDGQFEVSGSVAAVNGTLTNAIDTTIGCKVSGAGTQNLYDGWLKDIMFWDKALMPYEVIDLYNEGAGASPAIDAGGYESSVNLQGWWKLNDTTSTAADSSGNGNNGTYTNFTGTYYGTHYNFENYLEFDGTDDYVLLDSAVDLTSGLSTISCWYKSPDADTGTIFGNSASANISLRQTSATNIRLYLAGSANFTIGTPIVANAWHHLVIVVDATNKARVYVDGIESSTGQRTIQQSNLTINQLGRYAGGSVSWFNGDLDSLSVWAGTAASASEVTDLYNLGLGADPTTVIASPTLYYDFNEFTSTTTVVDESGNGNNGTMTNFTGTPFKGAIRRNALLFDGVDDAITISPWSSAATNNFTIACWFNVPEFAPTVGAGIILSDTTNFDYIHLINATTIRMRFNSGATNFSWTVPTMALDTWHALVITRDTSNNVKCYVDGVESTSGSYYAPTTIKFQRIGYYPNAAYVFDGTLSNLSLDSSNEATAAEALSFFENPLLSPYEIFSFDPEFWWPLNGEDTDAVAYDFSGNNNNGAMANFTGNYWVYRD